MQDKGQETGTSQVKQTTMVRSDVNMNWLTISSDIFIIVLDKHSFSFSPVSGCFIKVYQINFKNLRII